MDRLLAGFLLFAGLLLGVLGFFVFNEVFVVPVLRHEFDLVLEAGVEEHVFASNCDLNFLVFYGDVNREFLVDSEGVLFESRRDFEPGLLQCYLFYACWDCNEEGVVV